MSATALPRLRPIALARPLGALGPLAAVALSAALYGLAFAPLPGAWAAAWIALAPFFAVAARSSPLRAAGHGLLFGVAIGLATCWWLPEMLQRYFAIGTAASRFAALFAFVAFSGLHSAVFAAWVAVLARRGGVSPLAVASGFAACEWARASLGVAIPWALVAHSQIELRPIAQLGDLAGAWGIALLLAFANALLAAPFAAALRPRRPLAAACALGLAVAAAMAYGRLQLAREFADGPELRVALVQGGVVRGGLDAAASRAALERYLALTGEAVAATAPELVLWPEGAIDFSPFEITQRSLRLRDVSRAMPADLLLGAPRRDSDGRRRNAMVLLHRGRMRGVHDKLQPMAFSEHDPLPGPLALGRDTFAPGDAIRLFEIGGLRIGAAICSEAMGSELPRRLVAAGATLLANPSNDDWFPSAAAARQQLAMARLRAIESRRYVVRATPTGYSALIDPKGDVLGLAAFGSSEWLAGTVRGASVETVHGRTGGALGPVLLALCIGIPFVRRSVTQGESE